MYITTIFTQFPSLYGAAVGATSLYFGTCTVDLTLCNLIVKVGYYSALVASNITPGRSLGDRGKRGVLTVWKPPSDLYQDLMALGYVCGVFDGEGTVNASLLKRTDGKYRYSIALKLGVSQNVNRVAILVEFQRFFGVGMMYMLTKHHIGYRIYRQDEVRYACSILLLGCHTKIVQLHLCIYILDNWAIPSIDPVSFLRNCYLAYHIQMLNDTNSKRIVTASEIHQYYVKQGILTARQAQQAKTTAQQIINHCNNITN